MLIQRVRLIAKWGWRRHRSLWSRLRFALDARQNVEDILLTRLICPE